MIEYRKATIDEVELLAKIRVDFLREANDINTQDEIELMYNNNKQFMSDSFKDGSFVSWVAIDNGEIVATSGISFYTVPPNKKCPNGKAAYISNMFTYDNYRKQGIASKLLTLAVEEARNHGCKKVMLNAFEMGRYIYEKFGFINLKDEMVYHIV